MKKLLLLCLLTMVLFGKSVNYYKKQLQNLSDTQRVTMQFVTENAKEYNLKYTLLAICFKESQFGKYKLNLKSFDAGLFQQNLKYYCISQGLAVNSWNLSRAAEKLMNNDALAFVVALNYYKKLYKHFRKKYSSIVAWKKAIISYHTGIHGSKKEGTLYYKEIVNIIKAIHLMEEII